MTTAKNINLTYYDGRYQGSSIEFSNNTAVRAKEATTAQANMTIAMLSEGFGDDLVRATALWGELVALDPDPIEEEA